MAAKAAKPFGDRISCRDRGILGKVSRRQRAEVGDKVIDLAIRQPPTPCRNLYRCGLERLSQLLVLPDTAWHAVEDPLPQRLPLDVIEIGEGAGKQRGLAGPSMAT